MELYVNPTITDFRQDVNGDIKMLKIGVNKEDAYANIIGQAEGADLDNNKTKTINVSTYTEPVEVLPTAGKDGMKKATITLSNIPSPSGISTLYCWQNESGQNVFSMSETPSTNDKVIYGKQTDSGYGKLDYEVVASVTEGVMALVNQEIVDNSFERYSPNDVILSS